jgi:REP element-mobilizing transposase RayT
MTRPLRLEFPGALYHVTARGNAKQSVFHDDDDRKRFLLLLARQVNHLQWCLHAYCLMGNHYHLLLETPEPNLSRGMQTLNSAYSQYFNKRRDRVGHVFQGRYHAVIVEKEHYLLELSRYIVLNPVRAGLVSGPARWPWSSYLATAGMARVPVFLTVDWLLAQFGPTRESARRAYGRFVSAGESESPWSQVHGGLWLGSRSFRERAQAMLSAKDFNGICLAQQDALRPTPTTIVGDVCRAFSITEKELWARQNQPAFQAAVFLLRRVGRLSLREVAMRSGVSASRVSNIQRRIEDGYRPYGLDKILAEYRFRLSEVNPGERYEVRI